MKFERLTPPHIPLPDLVAFNRRVHDWIDPFFAPRWARWLAWVAAGLFAIFVAVWLYFATGLPSTEALLAYQPALPTMVRDYDGDPVQSFARERRVNLTYDEIPPVVVHAFISAEDKTFFKHHGVDFAGIVSAFWTNLWSGRRPHGASTITQQVARHLLGTTTNIQTTSVSYTRKIREGILAFRLESVLTKEQILDLYLNETFLGRNAYGIQAASRAYFDKDVGELTLPEAAYLAALPRSPTNYSPAHPDRALGRRDYVLNEMYKNGYVNKAQLQDALAAPLGTIRYGAGHIVQDMGGYYMEEVRRELIRLFGEDEKDGPNSVYAGGLWVRTSVVPTMQYAAANALREGLANFDGPKGWRPTGLSVDVAKDWPTELAFAAVGTGFPDWKKAVVLSKDDTGAQIGFSDGSTATISRNNASMPVRGGAGIAFDRFQPGMIIIVKDTGGGNYALRSIPLVSGGMLAEEVHTGRILAMQGGFDVVGSSYNRATQAERQPGSAFKPIVYETAFENGFTPASIVDDAPFCIWQGAGLGNKCFVNFEHGYAGPRTLRWGLEQSRNLMTVRLASQLGIGKITDAARKLRVGDYPNYLSISLGAGDTTVARLVNAYAILANHGRDVHGTMIDYVQDRNGKVIFRSDNRCQVMVGCNAPDWNGQPMPRPPAMTRQLLNPMAAFQMVHVMEGVIKRGTGVGVRDLDRPLFGKTGTTSGPTNVWFIAGTPDIVAGVYVGYDQPRPLGGVQGATIALPIWKQWAETALKDQPKVPFVAPPGIRWVRIDRMSGQRVYGQFPDDSDPKAAVIWEAFQPETEPRRSFRHPQNAPGTPGNPTGQTAQPQVAIEQRQQPQPTVQAPAPLNPVQPAPPQPAQPAPLQNPATAH